MLYRILELYGCTGTPNQGLRWTPERQFREIARIEREHPWLRGRQIGGVADPSIWDGSRGESVAETAAKWGMRFVPGDNERIPGWMQCHYRLQFDEQGYPRLYIFDTCAAFIRTVPLLQFSKTVPEDLDTEQEDHVADEWRYACMSRPVMPLKAEARRPRRQGPAGGRRNEGVLPVAEPPEPDGGGRGGTPGRAGNEYGQKSRPCRGRFSFTRGTARRRKRMRAAPIT